MWRIAFKEVTLLALTLSVSCLSIPIAVLKCMITTTLRVFLLLAFPAKLIRLLLLQQQRNKACSRCRSQKHCSLALLGTMATDNHPLRCKTCLELSHGLYPCNTHGGRSLATPNVPSLLLLPFASLGPRTEGLAASRAEAPNASLCFRDHQEALIYYLDKSSRISARLHCFRQSRLPKNWYLETTTPSRGSKWPVRPMRSGPSPLSRQLIRGVSNSWPKLNWLAAYCHAKS